MRSVQPGFDLCHSGFWRRNREQSGGGSAGQTLQVDEHYIHFGHRDGHRCVNNWMEHCILVYWSINPNNPAFSLPSFGDSHRPLPVCLLFAV